MTLHTFISNNYSWPHKKTSYKPQQKSNNFPSQHPANQVNPDPHCAAIEFEENAIGLRHFYNGRPIQAPFTAKFQCPSEAIFQYPCQWATIYDPVRNCLINHPIIYYETQRQKIEQHFEQHIYWHHNNVPNRYKESQEACVIEEIADESVPGMLQGEKQAENYAATVEYSQSTEEQCELDKLSGVGDIKIELPTSQPKESENLKVNDGVKQEGFEFGEVKIFEVIPGWDKIVWKSEEINAGANVLEYSNHFKFNTRNIFADDVSDSAIESTPEISLSPVSSIKMEIKAPVKAVEAKDSGNVDWNDLMDDDKVPTTKRDESNIQGNSVQSLNWRRVESEHEEIKAVANRLPKIEEAEEVDYRNRFRPRNFGSYNQQSGGGYHRSRSYYGRNY